MEGIASPADLAGTPRAHFHAHTGKEGPNCLLRKNRQAGSGNEDHHGSEAAHSHELILPKAQGVSWSPSHFPGAVTYAKGLL